MLLLVSGAMTTMDDLAGTPGLGAFWTPATSNDLRRLDAWQMPWGVDNGCFVLHQDKSQARRRQVLDGFMRYVWSRHWDRPVPPAFIAVPDEVGNHEATLAAFQLWYGCLKALDLPLAFVAQNGATPANLPWHLLSAVFIGGTPDEAGEEWKTGPQSAAIIREAKRRGKWVHVGRVNGQRRVRWCVEQGADSIDGSSFSMFPETWIKPGLEWIAQAQARRAA